MESCSSYFLPRLIGHSNTSYLVSTGGVFPPTAKHFGDLFNEVLSDPSHVLPCSRTSDGDRRDRQSVVVVPKPCPDMARYWVAGSCASDRIKYPLPYVRRGVSVSNSRPSTDRRVVADSVAETRRKA